MTKPALLCVEDLSIHAGSKALLYKVSFILHAGQSLTLVGESGAGKSLLAQAVMGNLPPSLQATGRITLDGVTTRAGDAKARRALWGRKIALLPQEPSLALNPLSRIAPQLSEVHALLQGHPARQATALAHEELETAGLGEAARHYPWQLSGGMAQRAVATMTLAGGAPVLMVDEPTKGLDAHWRDRTVALFKGVLQAGGCLLTITHDLRVAQALGGQVIVLREGQVVESGHIEAVMALPQHPFTRQLMAADPARWLRGAAPPVGDRVVQARGITKAYGTQPLFQALDLEIRQGERIAVQGPSGTGKSTLGNILLGLIAPDTGVVQRNPRFHPQALTERREGGRGDALREALVVDVGDVEDLEAAGTVGGVEIFAAEDEIADVLGVMRVGFLENAGVFPDVLRVIVGVGEMLEVAAQRGLRLLEQAQAG